ncbi:murein hydrolase activator EnvC family protein [Leucobacter musarum]|uniref:murein hydrolase activator EnvC family protein n=1 Tax=Leucobacter musarum TaxID=1930747 RepID=UPI000949A739|nr:M23 family metallopeptidase [Leucobacter musarum]
MTPPARAHRPALAARLIMCTVMISVTAYSAAGASTSANGAPAESAVPRWIPPLGIPLEISEPFRAPEHDYGPGHRGVDLSARPGSEVRAPAPGTVTYAGTVVDRGVVTIRVDHSTLYSIEPIAAALSVGDTVGLGALLGTVSEGGHCNAECVHLGVRVDDIYVDPARYFFDRPVLLPW